MNMDAELLPQDAKTLAVECFGTEQTSVVHGHKAKGYFPRPDYSMPHRLHGRDIWFAGTAAAWRRKYIALLTADDELREMTQDPNRMKEANARRHEHMTAASQVAEARGLELREELSRDVNSDELSRDVSDAKTSQT